MFDEGLFYRIGPLEIGTTVLTSWCIILVIWLVVFIISRRLQVTPGRIQTIVEGGVQAIENAVSGVTPQFGAVIMPFIGSLWVFLILANLAGLIPGVHSPTRDLSATAALAVLVFGRDSLVWNPCLGGQELPPSLSGAKSYSASLSSDQ